MSKISAITAKTKEGFLDRSRDLFSCLTNSPDDVFKRVLAAMKLDRQLNEDFIFFSEGLGQTGHAGMLAEQDLAKSLNHAISVCFMRCLVNGVIQQAVRLTDEADAQLMEIKYDAGLEPRPVKAPPAPVLSPAEAFDAQIKEDWNTLSYDKIKAKKAASAQYRKRLAELLDSGAIESQITRLHDVNQVGG